ncbi:MAG: ABC transporter ATP-binding protein, partial [Acidobacteriota bacterium]|nr:ABC transporter ATP-binding protein [Acidobacteriota bacterium]
MPSLLLEKVTFDHDNNFTLKDIDLSIPDGSFLALIGPNGSGKTTLMQLMSGLLIPRTGQITLDEHPLNQFNRRELARQI